MSLYKRKTISNDYTDINGTQKNIKLMTIKLYK